MESIPFNLPDQGLIEITGAIYLTDEFLVIEVKTSLVGEFDRDKRMIKIEPNALEAVYVKRGVFKDKLCLRPKKEDLLTALPGEHLGEAQLRFWRKHRETVRDLAATLNARRELAP